MNAVSTSPAGTSAERHFSSLRRRWRRRMATTLALASGAFFAAALIAARFLPWQPTFTAGVLAGGGDGLVPWLLEQPRRVAPQDVEAIRQIVSQLPAADLVRAPRDAN